MGPAQPEIHILFIPQGGIYPCTLQDQTHNKWFVHPHHVIPNLYEYLFDHGRQQDILSQIYIQLELDFEYCAQVLHTVYSVKQVMCKKVEVKFFMWDHTQSSRQLAEFIRNSFMWTSMKGTLRIRQNWRSIPIKALLRKT